VHDGVGSKSSSSFQVIFSDSLPYYADDPRTYDSWSIGVVFLELILGTPHVFTVDQRTRVGGFVINV